jgi:betaine-aldehyde dehydrogenase
MSTLKIPSELSMVVGGRQVAAADGETFETINPATGEVLATIPRAGVQDVERAVAAAHDAFPAWRDTPTLERVAALNSLAALVEENADVLGQIDVAENGSPIREMRKDAGVAAWLIRYLAGLALQVRGETLPSDPSRFNYSVLEPFGVVGRIIPFNHPALFAGSRLVAPLVTGNTVVMKPSEYTSISALKIAELASQVLPPGVFNVVTGFGQEAGDALVRHPLVRRLAFTGADRTGRAIQAGAAAVAVKTVTLELGGKNPIIIMPDADLDDAVDGAVRGMNFTWQGQSCGSTSRLLVHSSLREEFVGRLAERLEAMVAGAPDQLSTDTGSMVNPTQYDKVLSYLEIAKGDGARVVTGGEPADVPDLPNGLFFRPTLLEDVRPDHRIANEEIFGPIMVTIPFDTPEEAIGIANRVIYGLTASVYTRDLALAHRFARELQAGMVWINDSSSHIPGMSFGGVKDSGVGREESFDELLSYTQSKSVTMRFA